MLRCGVKIKYLRCGVIYFDLRYSVKGAASWTSQHARPSRSARHFAGLERRAAGPKGNFIAYEIVDRANTVMGRKSFPPSFRNQLLNRRMAEIQDWGGC
jgi:hypothetical protein